MSSPEIYTDDFFIIWLEVSDNSLACIIIEVSIKFQTSGALVTQYLKITLVHGYLKVS